MTSAVVLFVSFLLGHPFFWGGGSFALFRTAPVAYGNSQARVRIRVVAAGLRHSDSNTGSELHLQPMPNAGALAH